MRSSLAPVAFLAKHRYTLVMTVRRVIAIANQKGGVGKTTTVFNLGAALAELGYATLMLDLDPQAALTACCALDFSHGVRSLYTSLLRPNTNLSSIIQPVAPNLYLAPGSLDLTRTEFLLAGQPDRAHRLRGALERTQHPFDFVLMDTPPNLGLLTINALVAAQELLIPVQCQYLSMRGVRALLETVWRVHEQFNADLDLLGVLATMYRDEVPHCQEVLAELQAVFAEDVFDVVIDDQPSVAEAPILQQSILNYRPQSAVAQAYRLLAQYVIDKPPLKDDVMENR